LYGHRVEQVGEAIRGDATNRQPVRANDMIPTPDVTMP
jgi:hypothetical protein